LRSGGGEREAEQVVLFGGAAHPGSVLGEELAAGSGEPRGSAGQHVDRACIDEVVDDLERYANGQVGEPVAVEVAGGQRIAATVNGTFTFNVNGTLSDGSTFSTHQVEHFNVRPDGTAQEFFHCH
jgi:hypothetical protein